jgi:RNA polymerase sigma-70 factor (ECF subfamily)
VERAEYRADASLPSGLQVRGEDGPVDDVATTRVSDETRLASVYRQDGPAIWRALLAFTGDPSVAEDAMSEAFAQALARGDELREPARWVWRVSFRVAAGELKRRRTFEPLDVEPGYEHPDPIEHVIAALGRLSPNQRLAVVLHDYADRSVAEVAATIGASRATVHVHLSKGRRRLRELLEDDQDA